RQGNDVGPQYRSAIFFRDEADKALALEVKTEVTEAKIWPNPIVTTLEPLATFFVAEDYHQDYFARFEKASPAERMKFNAGYCSAVVAPKVLEFRRKFATRLKSGS
ncbi:MAG: peptide-methionine (S)-S-oxide reductase, partial [Fimbriimonadaceae bacterium]|nr:peptide-methionine (S)-S-oxide reductase [Fimbriimonadaceae bacterium]